MSIEFEASDWERPKITKHFTNEEWEEVTKSDELKEFVETVNKACLAKDYWVEDFRRAFYDAFFEEFSKRMCFKYNNGEAFSLSLDVK